VARLRSTSRTRNVVEALVQGVERRRGPRRERGRPRHPELSSVCFDGQRQRWLAPLHLPPALPRARLRLEQRVPPVGGRAGRGGVGSAAVRRRVRESEEGEDGSSRRSDTPRRAATRASREEGTRVPGGSFGARV
jgi:hypothetical protein